MIHNGTMMKIGPFFACARTGNLFHALTWSTRRMKRNDGLARTVKYLGLATFIFWSVTFVFLIGSFFSLWGKVSNLPMETSEDPGFAGAFLIMGFLILSFLTVGSVIGSVSGLITYLGGGRYIRKKSVTVLIISLILNIMIILGLIFLMMTSLLIHPQLGVISMIVLGPILVWFTITVWLTIVVLSRRDIGGMQKNVISIRSMRDPTID